MGTTRYPAKLWAIGGGLLAVVLVAACWTILISPQQDQTVALEQQAAVADERVSKLRGQLVELREKDANRPELEQRLTDLRQALPATNSVPDFLRQIDSDGDATNVSVSGVVVSGATAVEGSTAKVYKIPITLTATGTDWELEQFMDQLQRRQARAVLITNIATADSGGGDDKTASSDEVQMTITLKAFVAPDLGGAE